MIIPKKWAGGIGVRFRQPFFPGPRSVSAFDVGAVGTLRFALAFGVLLLVAAGASADPARLLKVRFSGDCNSFTIDVTGQGLSWPNPTVSYNITLTPRSGEPMTIVDSSPLKPEKDGKFHKTIHGTWEKFEFTLTDVFSLSGSAILTSDLVFLHTTPITFSRARLNCGKRR